jgi:hypothetical protein
MNEYLVKFNVVSVADGVSLLRMEEVIHAETATQAFNIIKRTPYFNNTILIQKT